MNQNYYRHLILPTIPITTEGLDKLLVEKNNQKSKRPYIYVSQNFEHLNLDLKKIFDSLGIFPDVLIIFGHTDGINRNHSSIVHSDIRYQDNDWVDVPCAINWEITDSTSNFYWWDVKGAKKCYPISWDDKQYLPPTDSENYLNRILGSGIHYQEWLNEDSRNYSILDSCTLDKETPILIKTSVPHSVKYDDSKKRISISLRFPLSQIPDWDTALKIFKFYSVQK